MADRDRSSQNPSGASLADLARSLRCPLESRAGLRGRAAAQHGGTLIIVPHGRVSELLQDGRYVRVKYGFTDEEPRRRVVTLMADIMNELARDEGANGAAVRWNTYEASRAQHLGDMDEALFEVAHLVADLTRVDGTVVMTDRLEILRFGVEIAGAQIGAGAQQRETP